LQALLRLTLHFYWAAKPVRRKTDTMKKRKLVREGPASQRHLIELRPPQASGKRDKELESADIVVRRRSDGVYTI